LSKVIVTETTLDETGITVRYMPSLKNELNKPTDEIVALALLASGELWVERKPRGSELTDSVLIPVTNVTATDILGIYVFANGQTGVSHRRQCMCTPNPLKGTFKKKIPCRLKACRES